LPEEQPRTALNRDSFVSASFQNTFSFAVIPGDQIKKDEIGRACGMDGGEGRCVRRYYGET
jgi:hypothetical protein